MPTLHPQSQNGLKGIECFDSNPELSDALYQLLVKVQEPDEPEVKFWKSLGVICDTDLELLRRAHLFHVVGYDGESYAWIEILGEGDPAQVAEVLARKLGAEFSAEQKPLVPMRFHRPHRKNWGIVIEGANVSRYLVERSIHALNDSRNYPNPTRELLRSAHPFFQCKEEDFLFVEFWCAEEKALGVAQALSTLSGVPLVFEDRVGI